MLLTFHMLQSQLPGLKSEVDGLISLMAEADGLQELLREAVGPAFSGKDARPWPLLPVAVCQSISGQGEKALPAAAALVLMRAAADVFDDVEDDDSPVSLAARHGKAAAVNAGSGLLILAERALTGPSARGDDPGTVLRAIDVFNSLFSTACAGQHQDLVANSEAMTEDEYLEIAGRKSATLTQCACHIGAVVGGADNTLVDIFDRLGYSLGMASQIADDIDGATRGLDLQRRKVTLPLVYALVRASDRDREWLRGYLEGKTDADAEGIRSLLFRTGAFHYAVVKMEDYRQQARDLLGQAVALGAQGDSLAVFVQ